MDYRYGSHTVFQIEYHFVWVTKYRCKVLTAEVAERVTELVRQVCATFEIKIAKGVVSKDHVHVLVSALPTMAPSEIMRRIKGDTASQLFEEFPHLTFMNPHRLVPRIDSIGCPMRSHVKQGCWSQDQTSNFGGIPQHLQF
jgi:putative transposase